MKQRSLGKVVADAQTKAKPPKHLRQSPNYKPGQRFDADRFAELCIKHGKDPAEAALKLLADPADLSQLKVKEQLDVYIRLMEFAYPKRRAIEGEIVHASKPTDLSDEDLAAIAAGRSARAARATSGKKKPR